MTPTRSGARKRTLWAMAHVLVVEDEAHISELVALHLSFEGHTSDRLTDGRVALDVARSKPYDLFILDVMLPGLDGVALCRALRQVPATRRVPVLLLTARREESDKVLGLDSGADDYLTKPFGVQELMARVRALLRRAHRVTDEPVSPGVGGDVIVRDGLEVDPARHQVTVDGRTVDTTAHEFAVLRVLAANPGIVFTRDAIIRKAWGPDTHVTERSVDTIVKRLRQKVERNPAVPERLLTVWGVGYKFRDVS
jgi:two-component system, OmpR family, alkaline phosphatase synthesis response regulator PhoP